MSSDLKKLLGKQVSVFITGSNSFNGVLRDIGQDILVIYNGQKFIYIPLLHVHSIQINTNTEEHVNLPNGLVSVEEIDSISFSKALSNAKSIYTEISVIGNLPYHGRIINILSDYLVFQSPIYKLIFIHFDHIKWLIPYSQSNTPYNLSKENLAVNTSDLSLLPTFEDQLKKEIGRMVVFNGGVNCSKMGLLNNVENNLLELVTASGETLFINLNHIKSVYLP